MNKPPIISSYKPGYVSVGRGSLATSTRDEMLQSGGVHPLTFPATRSVLWDHRHTGPPVTIHPTHYRNPVVIIEEKTLRLLQRFSQDCNSDTFRCTLIASLSVDPDGCGIAVTIDRLETGRGSADEITSISSLVPGDIVIPCFVKKNCAKPTTTTDQYENAISLLCERCLAKSQIDVGHFIMLRANCGYHDNNQTVIFHIDFDIVMAAPSLKTSPVNPVPIVPTALSKNLVSPLSISDVQGEPKSGYLSMDHTRKLLLILESDPKVTTLPLIGIWASGLANIHDPFIWASCLRYLFNKSLQDRMCVPPEPFLIVLYSPLHSKPEYYECLPYGGEAKLDFSLSTSHEVLQLPKDGFGRSASPMELELVCVEAGDKRDIFDIALQNSKQIRESLREKCTSLDSKLSGSLEDIIPRSKPSPHLSKAPIIKPSVPEVSLLFDDNVMSRSDESQGHSHNSIEGSTGYSLEGATSPHQHNMSSCGGQMPVQPPVSHISNNYHQYEQYPGQYVHPPESPYDIHHNVVPSSFLPQYTNSQHESYPVTTGPRPWSFPQGHPSQNHLQGQFSQGHRQYAQGDESISQGQFSQGHGSYTQGHYPPGSYAGPRPNQPRGIDPRLPQRMPSQGRLQRPNTLPRPQGVGFASQSWPQQGAYGSRQPSPSYQSQQPSPSYVPRSTLPQQAIHPTHNPTPPSHTSQSVRASSTAFLQQYQSQLVPSNQHTSQRQPVTKVPSPRQLISVPVSSQGVPKTYNSSQDTSPVHNSGSTDSGLHSNDSGDSVGHLDQSNVSVPAEVYERLREQDQQLKTLREQLAQLMANQNMSNTPQGTSKSDTSSTETCSKAINTTMLWPSEPQQEVLNSTNLLEPDNIECHLNTAADRHQHIYPQPALNHQSMNHQSMNHQSWNPTSSQNPSADPSPQRPHQGMTSPLRPHQGMTSPLRPHQGMTSPLRPHQADPSPPRSHHESPTLPSPVYPASRREERTVLSNDTLSLGEFHLTQLEDGNQESIVSDIIVDLPDYTSLSPDKLCSGSGYPDTGSSNRSPLLGESVSMYEQQRMTSQIGMMDDDDGDGDGEGDGDGYGDGYGDGEEINGDVLIQDQKLFYENLIGNVNKFLAGPVNGDDTHYSECGPGEETYQHEGVADPRPVIDQSINVAEMTRRGLQGMGVDLDSNSNNTTKSNRSDQSFFYNSMLLPKVAYMSMMMDSGDSDLSQDADALAMKYLSDEQLSVLAQQRSMSSRHRHKDLALQRVVSDENRAPTDLSMYGISSNHMSFASKKYLERYGLVNVTPEVVSVKEKEPTLRDHPALANVQQYLRKLNDRSINESLHSTAPFDHTNPKTLARYHSEGESFTTDKPVSGHMSASSDITCDRMSNVEGYGGVRGEGHVIRTDGGGDCGTPRTHKPHTTASSRVLDIERLKKLPKLL